MEKGERGKEEQEEREEEEGGKGVQAQQHARYVDPLLVLCPRNRRLMGLDPNQVSITSSEWKVWRVTFAP